MNIQRLLACGLVGASLAQAGQALFQDTFENSLGQGWSWVRENPAGWRTTPEGLEIRIEPGNMWGAANNAKNVLVRPVSVPPDSGVAVSVQVKNQPTEQYEQVDLVWYYDDSHMVKIGQERVNGQLTVVMGREEKDRTRTIAIIPLETNSVRLRLMVRGPNIWGAFQPAGAPAWKEAGTCSLPVPSAARPKISLQAYQGPANQERWARLTEFQVETWNPDKK